MEVGVSYESRTRKTRMCFRSRQQLRCTMAFRGSCGNDGLIGCSPCRSVQTYDLANLDAMMHGQLELKMNCSATEVVVYSEHIVSRQCGLHTHIDIRLIGVPDVS